MRGKKCAKVCALSKVTNNPDMYSPVRTSQCVASLSLSLSLHLHHFGCKKEKKTKVNKPMSTTKPTNTSLLLSQQQTLQ